MDRIKNIVESCKVDAYVITKTAEDTTEVFLVRDKIDLTRSASTTEYSVRIYKDFVEDEVKYRGSAQIEIGAMDSDSEIERKVKKAYFSAGYVKNKWYPLEKQSEEIKPISREPIRKNFRENFKEVVNAIYPEFSGASVNSCELFAKEGTKTLITSEGVYVTWPVFRLDFELVTEASGIEEVEIFNEYALGTLDIKKIQEITLRQLENTKNRALAKKARAMDSVNVIMSGDDVEKLFGFYVKQATDQMVYKHMSRAKKNERFIDKDLNILVKPLSFTADKAVVDNEGTIVKEFLMYENGFVKKFSAGCQYGSYLEEEVTGYANSFEVSEGEKTKDELLSENYLEILTFSDFQMDAATGDFGGEFRLARRVCDGEVSYLTGGAISGNIFKVQNNMEWSKERIERNSSLSPELILFKNMKVTGE